MICYNSLPGKNVLEFENTAVSLGMFDGLHRGHMAVLTAMKNQASGLKTAMFTFSTGDAKPDAKTGLHLLSREMRNALLEDFGLDYIIEPPFSGIRDMSPAQFAKEFLLEGLSAKKVFCGEDFRFGKAAGAGTGELRYLLSSSAELTVIPVVSEDGEPVSTTRIRKLLQDGDIAKANSLFGRPFTIDFPVEHGRELGRTMGLPTINQHFPENFALPKFGVYASLTVIDGVEHHSLTNVGVKPTVGSSHVLAETYIHGFKGDLYGKRIPVKLIEFVRDEKKFAGIGELKTQIEEDNKVAEQILGGKY